MGKEEYYNRYTGFEVNGEYKTLPFIQLDPKDSDIFDVYVKNRTRFDSLSEKYYDTPYYGWLILTANPIFGGLEFGIPNGTQIRVPYPLETTLKEYNDKLKRFKELYGI